MKALILNCSLKPSNQISNTDALLKEFIAVFEENGIETETVRVVDYRIAFGVEADMGAGDQWPLIAEKKLSRLTICSLERLCGSGKKAVLQKWCWSGSVVPVRRRMRRDSRSITIKSLAQS